MGYEEKHTIAGLMDEIHSSGYQRKKNQVDIFVLIV